MINIVIICGNGIGGSFLLKMKVEAICREMGVEANIESCDSNAVVGKGAGPLVIVKGFKPIFPNDRKVVIVKSYINRKKTEEGLASVSEEFK